MIYYNDQELQTIIDRHIDTDRGMRVIGLCLAAASGFLVAALLFGAARWFGWW